MALGPWSWATHWGRNEGHGASWASGPMGRFMGPFATFVLSLVYVIDFHYVHYIYIYMYIQFTYKFTFTILLHCIYIIHYIKSKFTLCIYI